MPPATPSRSHTRRRPETSRLTGREAGQIEHQPDGGHRGEVSRAVVGEPGELAGRAVVTPAGEGRPVVHQGETRGVDDGRARVHVAEAAVLVPCALRAGTATRAAQAKSTETRLH